MIPRAFFAVALVALAVMMSGAVQASGPASQPLTLVWGDIDCSGQANPIDSLGLLRADAGLPVNAAHPDCPGVGESVGQGLTWGNVDCIGGVTPVDSLKLLRADAGLPIDQAPGCPIVGEPLDGDPAPSFEEIAEHWAPVIYQDTAAVDYDADFITAFNFDGNYNGLDNWQNQPSGDLRAFVYYWVVETSTNWFIGYAMFHPRDWSEICFPLACHENDLEGVLLTVRRDGSPFGEFLLMSTIFHDTVPNYTDFDQAPSSGVTGLVDGDVQFLAGSHPIVYIEAKGHGITGAERWEDFDFPGGDGVVYSYGGVAQEPPSGNATGVSYDLADIQPLWARRCDTATFGSYGAFAGDDWTIDAANAPWGWSGWGYQLPVFFLGPASGIGDSFGNLGPFTRWDDGFDNDGDTVIDEADEGYTAASFSPPPLTAPFSC